MFTKCHSEHVLESLFPGDAETSSAGQERNGKVLRRLSRKKGLKTAKVYKDLSITKKGRQNTDLFFINCN